MFQIRLRRFPNLTRSLVLCCRRSLVITGSALQLGFLDVDSVRSVDVEIRLPVLVHGVALRMLT